MSLDPRTFTPLRHRLLISAARLTPTSRFFPGFKEPPPNYHPAEVPAFVRKRLIDFLENRYPIPPRYLRNLIPPSEVALARRIYRQLRAGGMEQGDTVLEMGLMARNLGYNLPEANVCRILARGCDCVTTASIITSSSAGEPVEDDLFVIRCHEALAAIPQKAEARLRASATSAENRRRLAFDAIRSQMA